MTPPAPGSAPPLIDEALLDRLLRTDDPLAIEDLGRQRHLSAAAILRGLNQLRAAGCTIEEQPDRGVRLVRTSPAAWIDYLRWRDAQRGMTGRAIEVYQRTASTQDVIRRLIQDRGPAADGALAIADEQSAGRGRRGNKWVAPPGSAVLFSRAWAGDGMRDVNTAQSRISVDRMMFAAAVGVARAIEEVTAPRPLPVSIKWPNDILIEGQKIAGILVETLTFPRTTNSDSFKSEIKNQKSEVAPPRASIIGIGINVDLQPEQLPPDQPELRARLTSLSMQGRRVDRLRVLSAAIDALDQTLAQRDPAPLIDEWRRRSTLLAQDVRLRHNGQTIRGHVVDVDPYDGLIVRADTGEMLHLPADTTTVL